MNNQANQKTRKPTRTDVYNAVVSFRAPFFVCTSVLYKLGFHSADSNHEMYRPVLRHLHKLKDQKHLDSMTLPEANITIWWLRSRIADVDDIPF